MTPPPIAADIEFFELRKSGGRDVHGFNDLLHKLYTTPETSSLPYDRWYVTEIKGYKNQGKKTVQHEFILATVQGPGKNNFRYLRIHRRIQKGSVVSSPTTDEQPAAAAAAPESSAADSSDMESPTTGAPQREPNSIKKRALDDITVSKDPRSLLKFGKSEVVEHVTFPTSHISLPQLAVLTRCINEAAAGYHLATSNCYWFAYTLSEALKQKHDGKVIESNSKKGTWNGLAVNFVSRKIDIPNLNERFMIEWDEFVNRVCCHGQ
ncbi:hypothetical protein AMATHDRAFT_51686 [Amanita thiersii Skay4041]|uniref:Uncharacterized protein n=1 Tax=Amanita thiersii Skay4041 TaxID=703135 RepID=A0A2A9N6N0_9AGAR|nr:hypothetical protein AMATHDRAFT_51686 [Amanita thiersii Skay4041]